MVLDVADARASELAQGGEVDVRDLTRREDVRLHAIGTGVVGVLTTALGTGRADEQLLSRYFLLLEALLGHGGAEDAPAADVEGALVATIRCVDAHARAVLVQVRGLALITMLTGGRSSEATGAVEGCRRRAMAEGAMEAAVAAVFAGTLRRGETPVWRGAQVMACGVLRNLSQECEAARARAATASGIVAVAEAIIAASGAGEFFLEDFGECLRRLVGPGSPGFVARRDVALATRLLDNDHLASHPALSWLA